MKNWNWITSSHMALIFVVFVLLFFLSRMAVGETAPNDGYVDQGVPTVSSLESICHRYPMILQAMGCHKSEQWYKTFIEILINKIVNYRLSGWTMECYQKVLLKCEEKLKGVLSETSRDRLNKFIQSAKVDGHPRYRYGFEMTDDEYIASRPPMMIAIPDFFKNGLPENWKEWVREQNKKPNIRITYTEFNSRLVDTKPFFSYRRLVFLIEHFEKGINTYDQYFMVTMPMQRTDFIEWFVGGAISIFTLGGEVTEWLYDLITIQKTEIGDPTKVLTQPKIHFAEYDRGWIKGDPVKLKHYTTESCFRCHPSGPRHIKPAYGTVYSPDDWIAIKYINEKITASVYFGVDWEGLVTVENLGPGIGRKNSQCTRCYNNFDTFNEFGEDSRGQLTYRMNWNHIYGQMVDYLHMPPGVMSTPERRELMEVLGRVNGDAYTDQMRRFVFDGVKIGGYEYLLNILVNSDRLHWKDGQRLMPVLEEAQEEMAQRYDEILRDYKEDLRDWLNGQ